MPSDRPAQRSVVNDGENLHRVLVRQLRRLDLTSHAPLDDVTWAALLSVVSDTYTQSDNDRYILERSIDISSSEMRGLHEVLSRRALQDVLTGLPNRAAAMQRITDVLVAQERGDARPSAVLFIDLDGFKLVNDSLGHEAGDELLIQVSARMRRVAGADLVARLGGDEFVVVCERMAEPRRAQALAARIVASLKATFQIGDVDVSVGASVGVALTVAEDVTAEEVLRRADLAMYVAKTTGKDRFVPFSENMQSELDHQVSIKADLQNAIRRNQLLLDYQPIVRLSDHQVVGTEALLRWSRPGYGLLKPKVFLPIATESSLIREIDVWVISRACARAADWCARGMTIGINLSPRSLESTDIVHELGEALRANDIAPAQVLVELSEASLLSGSASEEACLDEIRALGVRLAIDDFGAGYSSLSRLRTIPASALKLHGSLIADLDERDDVTAIVGAAITMGHALGYQVIAEGVERRGQADLLRSLGCDHAQGYLFGRPGAPEILDASLPSVATTSRNQEVDSGVGHGLTAGT